MNEKKIEKLIHNIYRELYNNATPKADFDKLMEKFNQDVSVYKTEEERMENAYKHNFYDNHVIDSKLMDNIMEKHLSKSKLSNYMQDKIKSTIFLGCSPKCKYN